MSQIWWHSGLVESEESRIRRLESVSGRNGLSSRSALEVVRSTRGCGNLRTAPRILFFWWLSRIVKVENSHSEITCTIDYLSFWTLRRKCIWDWSILDSFIHLENFARHRNSKSLTGGWCVGYRFGTILAAFILILIHSYWSITIQFHHPLLSAIILYHLLSSTIIRSIRSDPSSSAIIIYYRPRSVSFLISPAIISYHQLLSATIQYFQHHPILSHLI